MFFTGLPVDEPGPECVRGTAELALAVAAPEGYSRCGRKPAVGLGLFTLRRPAVTTSIKACDTSPLADSRG